MTFKRYTNPRPESTAPPAVYTPKARGDSARARKDKKQKEKANGRS